MTKISHFTAVGLLVLAGYSLSLGVDGRAQVAAISDVVTTGVSDATNHAVQFSRNLAFVTSNLSFANVYTTLGVLIGAVPDGIPSQQAAVTEGLVVTEHSAGSAVNTQVQQVQSSFSDTVKVRPDATKKSGTITPVFRGVEGQNYTYVIVPVKK